MPTNPIDEEARLKRLAALAARCDARALLADIEARGKRTEKERAAKAARAQAAASVEAAKRAKRARKKKASTASIPLGAKLRRAAAAQVEAQSRNIIAILGERVRCHICGKVLAYRHLGLHLEAHEQPSPPKNRPAQGIPLDPERLAERRAHALAARRQREERPD